MKKYEIQCFFGKDEQHLVETTRTYPRTLDEAFPQTVVSLFGLAMVVVDIFLLRP
jgi:hypothetical protein